MDPGIKILYLEDNPGDAVRVEHKLRESGLVFDLQRVETREAFMAGLEMPPDAILSDHGLPSFDGLTAYGRRAKNAPTCRLFSSPTRSPGKWNSKNSWAAWRTMSAKTNSIILSVALRHALHEAKEWRSRRQRVKEYFNLAARPIRACCRSARVAKKFATTKPVAAAGGFLPGKPEHPLHPRHLSRMHSQILPACKNRHRPVISFFIFLAPPVNFLLILWATALMEMLKHA